MVLSFFDSHFWRDQFIKISDYTHFIHKSCHKNFLFPYSNFVVPCLILFSICVGWFIWLTCRLLCTKKEKRQKKIFIIINSFNPFQKKRWFKWRIFFASTVIKHIRSYCVGGAFFCVIRIFLVHLTGKVHIYYLGLEICKQATVSIICKDMRFTLFYKILLLISAIERASSKLT